MYLLKFNQSLLQFSKSNRNHLLKSISTSIINYESNLSLLRKRTGLTFTLCKKALEANNNDLKLAEEWLKEEVKKSGLAKSEKMTFRLAKEGLVGVFIDNIKKNGIILEVNCETDFVAKNSKFKELVSRLTKDFASIPQIEERPIQNSIQKYVLNQNRIPKENEKISEAIIHLGEKIEIKKACFIKNHFDDPSISLVGYAHSTEGMNNNLNDVTFGKYGTIVALKQLQPDEFSDEDEIIDYLKEQNEPIDKDEFSDDEPLDFNTAAKQICQHIIVAAPEQVRRKEDNISSEEKENLDKDSESSKLIRQSALIEQEFLHSDYTTVDDFLRANNLDVIDFVRVKCGDE